jgi:hypothetical protein
VHALRLSSVLSLLYMPPDVRIPPSWVQALESAERDLQQALEDAREQLQDEKFDHEQTRKASVAHVESLEAEVVVLKSRGPNGAGGEQMEFAMMTSKLRSELQTAQVRVFSNVCLADALGDRP